MSLRCRQLSLGITVWEEMSFDEFQDGRLKCRNGMNLAVLILHVSPINASHQVSAQSDIPFGSRSHFKDGHRSGHFEYRNGMLLAILNFYVAPMSPIKFQLNPTYGLGGDVV